MMMGERRYWGGAGVRATMERASSVEATDAWIDAGPEQGDATDLTDYWDGRDAHVLRNTKYAGLFRGVSLEHAGDDWYTIRSADGTQYAARLCDLFETEQDARDEARRRRKPREAREFRPLYGDYAQLAAMSGIRTDGSGRRA